MSFFNELKRRNVIRVGIAYVIVAWLVLQFADVVLNNIEAPHWVFQVIMLVLGIGLPVVLVFAWAFEMTPEGIKKEKNIDRSQSITNVTGQKLNYTIISLLVVVLGYFVWEAKFQHASREIPASAGMTNMRTVIPGSQTAGPGTSVIQKNVSAETPAAASQQEPSIAVLPFANRSRNEDDQFFTDGMHDDLLTQLAKIGGLKVISRTSVMKYRDTQKTIPEIAQELGVSTILEGGIQRAGKRIRINAQLIDVATDEHLWAETFDREMTMENIFDIQSEISRQIVSAVKGELSETEQQVLNTAPTNNLEAWEAYLHARAATNRADYNQDKYIEAQPWAEQAVKLDPNFAEAWALLAEIHAQAVWIGFGNIAERRAAGREALANAVRLKPDSAKVKAAQADQLYRFDNDYPAALAAYNDAHAMAPGDANILLFTAVTLRRLGRWEDAIDTFEQSMALDPANVFTKSTMADTLVLMRAWKRLESRISGWVVQYPEALDLKGDLLHEKISHRGDLIAARAILNTLPAWNGNVYFIVATTLAIYERNADALFALLKTPEIVNYLNSSFGLGQIDILTGDAYRLKGDAKQATRLYQQAIEGISAMKPVGTYSDANVMSGLAIAYAKLRDYGKALDKSRRAMTMLPRDKDHIFGAAIAQTHTLILAMAGHRDEALQRLAADIDGPEGYTRWELYLDPAWDFFRDDERFNALARPKNLKETRQ